MRFVFVALIALWLSACSPDSEPIETTATLSVPDPVFHESGNPKTLTEWGQIASNGVEIKLASEAIIFDLNSALFSDYALKLRTVWLPDGRAAQFQPDQSFDFPIGTVITKTFYYPRGTSEGQVLKPDESHGIYSHAANIESYRLLETRILAHRKEGWIALPYVWNDAQTQAELKRIGDIKPLTLVDAEQQTEFAYVVPNVNQCAGCHATNNTTRKIEPIGPKARHLNRDFAYETGPENQLKFWEANGVLDDAPAQVEIDKTAIWNDDSASVNERARAYLDINCAHCHNKVGPADTSGLHLEPDTKFGPNLGLCKPPIAAGTGTGGRLFGIIPGKPEDSIFVYRTASTDPAVMMPELGRSLAHNEGVALLEEWIKNMPGNCTDPAK